ncbi:MAG: hypothetical protein WAM77_18605 [Xanthobacteraceae bacterium]|jgi:hypothetical protein
MSTAVSRWSLTSPKAKCAFDGVCSTGRPAECGLAKPGLFDSVNVKNHEKKNVIYVRRAPMENPRHDEGDDQRHEIRHLRQVRHCAFSTGRARS